MALPGEEMNDATELPEQLSTLLELHGLADLLRALSASARGLAERCPDREDEWIRAALTAAQAAETHAEDGSHASAVADEEEIDDHGEGDEEDEGENEDDDDEDTPLDGVAAASHEPASPSPSEDASMKKSSDILPPRNDVTHWRVRRVSEDGKNSSPELCWGSDSVEYSEWELKELSFETLRRRWGAGRYRIFWFGREAGHSVGLGRSNPIRLLDRPGESREPEPARVTTPPPEAASGASGGPGELLAALAAMRPSQTGGMDMAAMLQLFAFMSEQQNRQARIVEDRIQAERAIMMERERLSAKERIAQIEATAHAQARGRGGFDQQALVEAIKEALAPADEGEEESTPTTTLAAGSSDVAKIVDAVKEMLVPVVTAFVGKIMSDPSALPGAYKPSGT